MTHNKAFQLAKKWSKSAPSGLAYVVWAPEEQDHDGEHYQPATVEDLDTFYNGAEVIDGLERGKVCQ